MDTGQRLGQTVDPPAERPRYQGRDATKTFTSRSRDIDFEWRLVVVG